MKITDLLLEVSAMQKNLAQQMEDIQATANARVNREEEEEEEEEEVCILRRIIYERLPSKTSLHMIAALL